MGRQGSLCQGTPAQHSVPISWAHTGDLGGRQVDSLCPGLTWAVTHAQTPGSQTHWLCTSSVSTACPPASSVCIHTHVCGLLFPCACPSVNRLFCSRG